MKRLLSLLSLLLTCAVIISFAPQSAHATDSEWSPSIKAGSSHSIKVSESNADFLYFSPQTTGAYELSSQTLPTHIRVFLYESVPVDPEEDSDGWERLSYYDFQGGEVIDFPFYAKSGKTYMFEFEASFESDETTININLDNSTRAGIYKGFVYSVVKDYDDRVIARITGYEGPREGNLVVPGEINGNVVTIVDDWAISGDFTTITLEEGIEELHNCAISGSDNLVKVSLPSTLHTFYSSFDYRPNLTTIEFPNGSEDFYVQDYNLINKVSKTVVLVFGKGRDEYRAPEGMKYIDAYALDSISPKIIWLPASVKDVFQMPSSLTEMHIANANCNVSYYGIPWTDWTEDDEAVYTVKVYAPANGSLEAYCNENNITFIPEGDPYDPNVKLPMGDPINLNNNETTYFSFDTTDGDYREIILKPAKEGDYGIGIGMSSEWYAYTLVDSEGKSVEALEENPMYEEEGPMEYLFHLEAGKTYVLTLQATDVAKTEQYCGDDVEIYITGTVKVAVPVGKTLTYSDKEQTGIESNPGYTLYGEDSATDAGVYYVTAKLNRGYVWSDGTREEKEIEWEIKKAVSKVKIPSGKTLTYTGKTQMGVAKNNRYKLAGTFKAQKAGSYKAKLTLLNDKNHTYKWSDNTTGAKTIKWKINKAKNSLAVKGKTANVKFANLKKKNQVLAVAKTVKVSKKGQGKLTYTKASGNKKITVNKKNGNITIKKGLKKGTYKVKVKVTAAGNANYKSITKIVTVEIKVK